MQLGISQGVVNRWFQDDRTLTQPRPQSLVRVAEVTGIPHSDLMKMCGYISGEPVQTDQPPDLQLELLIRDLRAGWPYADDTRKQVGADTVRTIFNVHSERRPNRRSRKPGRPKDAEDSLLVR
jgi:transcriptional regulator with XRE-family HTH domain